MCSCPPGFRFFPTEEELLSFYLYNKLSNLRSDIESVIPVADVFSLEPWILRQLYVKHCLQDPEQWFFFCPRQEREAHGGRPNRITPSGYWKATGTPSLVYSSTKHRLGVKKTMVFYMGRAIAGKKTMWKMNEYRLFEDGTISNGETPKLRGEFRVCRLYIRSGTVRSFDRRPLAIDGDGASHLRSPERTSDCGDNGSKRKRRRASASRDGACGNGDQI